MSEVESNYGRLTSYDIARIVKGLPADTSARLAALLEEATVTGLKTWTINRELSPDEKQFLAQLPPSTLDDIRFTLRAVCIRRAVARYIDHHKPRHFIQLTDVTDLERDSYAPDHVVAGDTHSHRACDIYQEGVTQTYTTCDLGESQSDIVVPVDIPMGCKGAEKLDSLAGLRRITSDFTPGRFKIIIPPNWSSKRAGADVLLFDADNVERVMIRVDDADERPDEIKVYDPKAPLFR